MFMKDFTTAPLNVTLSEKTKPLTGGQWVNTWQDKEHCKLVIKDIYMENSYHNKWAFLFSRNKNSFADVIK